jgi:hypothetical protein
MGSAAPRVGGYADPWEEVLDILDLSPEPRKQGGIYDNEDVDRILRFMLPSYCTIFGRDDLELVGSSPVEAGGFADLWQANLGDRRVVLKSYRRHANIDTAGILQVGSDRSLGSTMFTSRHRDSAERFQRAVCSHTRISSRLLGFTSHRFTPFPWSLILQII